MFYAILTRLGSGGAPFQYGDTPPTAPGEPMRVSEKATLVVFERHNDRLFASSWASAYGKLLWYVPETLLHPEDLPDATEFASCQEFQNYLVDLNREEGKCT